MQKMTATDTAVTTIGYYLAGKWETPQGRALHPVINPATGKTMAETAYATGADVDRAVRNAHDAFLKWRDVPVVDRVQPLHRFKALLEKHAHEIASILSRRVTGEPDRDADTVHLDPGDFASST
jgi:malonate-semialdehyde dehydrogenase (acetylating)/methylmalonate-semialdehyde dehydrogenase